MKKILLLTICYLIVNAVFAQNLVKNGSFEKHPTIDFRERHNAQPFDWQASRTILCDCNYEEKVKIHAHGFNEHTCLKSGAFDGCSMIKLRYTHRCKCSRNDDFSGSASYITSTLSQTLEIGKFYKVTYWSYYADRHNTEQHPSILDNLGFILTSKNPQQNNSCLIQTRAMTSDNFQKDEWFKTEKIIIPTCELNYLTIGVFRNKDWVKNENTNYHGTHYFIDNVSVVEVKKEDVNESITSYNFCNKLPEPTAEIKADNRNKTQKFADIYFETNESNPLNNKELDEIAIRIKADKETIFLISGHTDNIGSDNETLSKKRVETVIKYLTQRHKIPKYRLITAYFGATKPIVSNDTEANRAKNRRVTIEALEMRKSKGIYRQALLELKNGNTIEALKLFRGWEMNEENSEKILAYFDVKTDNLRQDKRWSIIDNAIRKSYEQYMKPHYAFVLDSLYCEDQKYRRLNTYVQDLAGYIKVVDTEDWEYPTITNVEQESRDRLVYTHLIELLASNKFPKQSEVGERSAKAVAVILIHSHDTTALKKYLPIMFEHCQKGEAQFGYYAMMFDKLCVLQNKGQRYGTQYVSNPRNPAEMILAKLENPLKVNLVRSEITLLPLNVEIIEKALKE